MADCLTSGCYDPIQITSGQLFPSLYKISVDALNIYTYIVRNSNFSNSIRSNKCVNFHISTVRHIQIYLTDYNIPHLFPQHNKRHSIKLLCLYICYKLLKPAVNLRLFHCLFCRSIFCIFCRCRKDKGHFCLLCLQNVLQAVF